MGRGRYQRLSQLRHKHGKRVAQAYTIGLSINENLKLEKGKEKGSSAARSYIQSSGHVTATCYYVTAICRNLTVICQCRNITPPPSAKACPQALYIRIMPIGRFYLYILPIAYPLYYCQIIYILGSIGHTRVTYTGSCIINLSIEPQGPRVKHN